MKTGAFVGIATGKFRMAELTAFHQRHMPAFRSWSLLHQNGLEII
jgi:hypothetical protein